MLQQTNKGIVFRVKVIPKASRTEIVGWEKDELKIRVAAVPEKGEANTVLIKFLAHFFAIGHSKIQVVRGETSRHKQICIQDISLADIEDKIKKI
jgi:uncharacterized protein (TIGR00251 family)